MKLGLMLSQGGEFAFVVMSQAMTAGVVSGTTASMVSIVVGISMAMTSPLILLYNKVFSPPKDTPADYDSIWDESEPEVIIAGFGRVGQIVGRILAANSIRFTALDSDAEHIEFMRRFGNKVFFGDPTRLDLLETAGLRHAKVLLVAVDDAEDALSIVELVRRECPHIKIIARSLNRVNLLKQRRAGADVSVRETFGSSLDMARSVLTNIGVSGEKAAMLTRLFMKHDEGLIEEALKHPIEMDKLIEIGTHGREELELLFKSDQGDL
jgi:voltage-gated potassium channel Kch